MKRLLSVCFAMIITFALLTAACAEGIDNTLDTVAEEQEILSGMIEPEVSESEDLALTGDSASTDVQSQEVQASEDHAVSAPMPKAGNCAHKKYSKINGAYKHYTQVDSKKHSVTSYAPDPSIYPEATFYFVKCDACSETGFWYKDEWEHRITWESENEAFYYEYSLFCNRSEYTEAHTFANGRCSKCGCKGSDTITVKLSARSVTLGEKETFKLSATVKPSGKANSLRYYSSNTKAATVDSKTGKITAKKAGTATINAKIDSKTLATCKVTVKKAPNKVTLNKSQVTLEKGKTCQLKATLPAGTYTSKLTWTSSNAKVVKVSSKGKVTAVGQGTAKIIVKTTGGVKATCKVTVKAGKGLKEMIGYLIPGADFNKTVKEFGLVESTLENTPEQHILYRVYYKDELTVSNDWKHEYRIVSGISIDETKEPKYCLDGVNTAMTAENGVKTLLERGWHLKHEKEEYYDDGIPEGAVCWGFIKKVTGKQGVDEYYLYIISFDGKSIEYVFGGLADI